VNWLVVSMKVTLDSAWALSPLVALRPEPFGALAYHFGNRKLTFLKTPALVGVVRGLAEGPDVRTALAAAGVPGAEYAAYLSALQGLAETDMIQERAA
jgi:putative mycofactocin binding protein MftB